MTNVRYAEDWDSSDWYENVYKLYDDKEILSKSSDCRIEVGRSLGTHSPINNYIGDLGWGRDIPGTQVDPIH